MKKKKLLVQMCFFSKATLPGYKNISILLQCVLSFACIVKSFASLVRQLPPFPAQCPLREDLLD